MSATARNGILPALLTAMFFSTAGVNAAAGDSTASLTIHADRPGATISKNVYGQFSEHLGTGIYGGIWVGKDSPIPNTNGIRNDVVAALRDLHVPMVRWPGGCFADTYHWRDGIGPQAQRPTNVNYSWGGVPDDNAFGTHEFFDFLGQIGADAYVNANVGTGSPREAAEWLEYMTGDQDSAMVRLRRANGRDKPWKVSIYAIGNETWGCGGNMTSQDYAGLYNRYATFMRTPQNPKPELLASGDSGNDNGNATVPDFTRELMARKRAPMDAISFHYYTTLGSKWGHMDTATGFGEEGWINTLSETLRIEGMIKQHIAVMQAAEDKVRKTGATPEKTGLYIDEWGTWYHSEPGSHPGFLVQQNTQRDALVAAANFNIFHKYADRVRMTAIAQTVNVLQAMILTDGPKMVLTPTYYVYQMYIPFQGATSLPIDVKTADYSLGKYTVPTVSASAAKAKDGSIVVALANLDPDKAATVSVGLTGAAAKSVTGTVLTADATDARNTFENPNAVKPAAFHGAKISGGTLQVRLPAKSVVVLKVK